MPFDSLTSLTGGGGLTSSSSSSAGSGDSATGDFNVGGMSFGRNNTNNQLLMLAGFGLLALLILKK